MKVLDREFQIETIADAFKRYDLDTCHWELDSLRELAGVALDALHVTSRKSTVMTKLDILETALKLVGGDRHKAYGDAYTHYSAVAVVWNGILAAAGKPAALEAHDVANLMEGLKIVRRYCGPFKEDNYVDGAGYAAVAGECKQVELKRNTTEEAPSATEHAKSPSVPAFLKTQQECFPQLPRGLEGVWNSKKEVDR